MKISPHFLKKIVESRTHREALPPTDADKGHNWGPSGRVSAEIRLSERALD